MIRNDITTNLYEEVIINDSLEESVIDCKFLVAWHYMHNNDTNIPCMSKLCKDCIKEWLDRIENYEQYI